MFITIVEEGNKISIPDHMVKELKLEYLDEVSLRVEDGKLILEKFSDTI
ncbi:MAG: hypothetical protein R6W96_06995 [Clostridia bacterium]